MSLPKIHAPNLVEIGPAVWPARRSAHTYPPTYTYIHINKCTHKQSSLIIKIIACDSVDCIGCGQNLGLLSSPVCACTNLQDPATASLVLNSVMWVVVCAGFCWHSLKRTHLVFFVGSESFQCSTELLCAISNPIIILTTLLGNLYATIANLDQDSITSMDSCKIEEALTDKCHQSYSKYKTHYQGINDMENEDNELLSLRSEVDLDDAVDMVCDHHFNMYGSCYVSRQKNCMDPFQEHQKKCTSKYMPRPLS